jgi:hypothetical protein
MKRLRCWLLLLAGFTLATAIARAEESQFAYTYTTDLLPKGGQEAEQWLTWRHGKSQGDYDVFEGRTAYEYGLTDKLQGAVYFNYLTAHAHNNDVDGTTLVPENFAEVRISPNQDFNRTKFLSASVEGIYRLLSPYTHAVGLALYVEPSIGKDFQELESKIIAQSNFLEDRLVTAANLTVAQERRYLQGDPNADPADEEFNDHWDKETDLNLSLAASYRFAAKWSAGAELMNEREFSSFSMKGETRTNSGFYFGPTVHYGGKSFFVTGTYLEQLRGARDFANPGEGEVVNGRNYADDFERRRVRLKVGYYFGGRRA